MAHSFSENIIIWTDCFVFFVFVCRGFMRNTRKFALFEISCYTVYMKGREAEWSNPQTKCGKVSECPENKFLYKINYTLYPKENHQQLLKHNYWYE